MALEDKTGSSGFISPEIHILTVRRKKDSWNFPSLSAPYWRLYWIEGGDQWVFFRDKRIKLKAGRRYLIPPDTDFSGHSRGEIDQIYIHFLINRRESLGIKPREGIYELVDRPMLASLFTEALDGGEGALDYRHSQIAVALCSLALADLPPHVLSRSVRDERIKTALAFIHRTLGEPVTAAEIAAAAGMGQKSLERRFRNNFNETPLQFKRRLRVEQACLKLHFTEDSLESIAEDLGFSDRFHLTRVFTFLRGISPGRYRKMVDELP